ncbi:hypothetical protein Ancab_009975 [Ancistrocladus abbreviatus]
MDELPAATFIGKPEKYVMIVLKGSVPMAFGGTEQPAAFGELLSVGGLKHCNFINSGDQVVSSQESILPQVRRC